LHLLPSAGFVPLKASPLQNLKDMILPTVTLATALIGSLTRYTRAVMVDVLEQDYIRTARAKGLRAVTVLRRHALANAAIPIVTVIGIGIALLIGGVVVTETVFAIPGLGQLTVDAVLSRDFPLIQGITLFFSVIYVLINLLIDVSYLVFDPRIRY
jgi:peptide/nickel transport system permease protein